MIEKKTQLKEWYQQWKLDLLNEYEHKQMILLGLEICEEREKKFIIINGK